MLGFPDVHTLVVDYTAFARFGRAADRTVMIVPRMLAVELRDGRRWDRIGLWKR